LKPSDLILEELTWDISAADSLLATLVRLGGRVQRVPTLSPPPAAAESFEAFDLWVSAAAPMIGRQSVGQKLRYLDFDSFVGRASPLILRVRVGETLRLIGLIGGSRHVLVVTAHGRLHRLKRLELRALVCSAAEANTGRAVDAFLDRARLRGRPLARARRALLLRQGGGQIVADAWLLQAAGGSVLADYWRAGVVHQFGTYVGAYTLHYFALIGAWSVVGLWALRGSFATGWFSEWLLLLATVVVLSAYCRWAAGVISVRVNAVIKKRLLEGALTVNSDRLRTEGMSHLFGRVLESNTIQTALVDGAFGVAVATIEAVFAVAILSVGASGAPHALLFIAWVVLLGGVHWVGYRHRRRSTEQRVHLTHGLVEKMVGNRTRLAQQDPTHWHDGEDEELCHYHEAARLTDTNGMVAEITGARTWMIASAVMLVPALMAGASVIDVAIAVGGMLLAESALLRYLPAGTAVVEGLVAWRNVSDLLQSPQEPRDENNVPISDAAAESGPVIECHEITYHHNGRATPVISDCTLVIRSGDRVLIEGESGSGKSTLCALLAGSREPDSGLVLLHGLDRRTVGSTVWRRHVAAALQFHENHVFTESFAFNLLMGRRWPPTAADLAEAHAVCTELGLGGLLTRMPAGMFQVIGDYGWQLSHGERSRLFIGRALLQRAEIIILDESFGALDSNTLEQTLQCVMRRAPTLIVVAHP
jgi:ATP-binding cassette subfamily B protein